MSQQTEQPALANRTDRKAELRNVIAMTVPVVITTSSRAVMDMADFIMISHLGEDASQAAILPAQIAVFTFIVIPMGITSVASTFVSQSLGRGEERECGTYAWQVIYISIIFGLLAFFCRPFLPDLIALFGHEPLVQQRELEYTRITILTTGPTTAAAGLAWYFIGIHKPYVAMWSALEANVVNILASLAFIYGIPQLGIEGIGFAGAAWGTLIGVSYRSVRLVITLLLPEMERRYGSRSGYRLSLPKLMGMFRIGVPCALHWVSEISVWAIFVNILVGGKFGTIHQIATNTAWQFMRVGFMPTIGVGQAITSLVGKSIGAGLTDRAQREVRMGVLIALGYMGTLSIIFVFFGRSLIALFNDKPEVVRVGGWVMVCAAIFQLFDAVAIVINAALRGAGDTFWPSVFFVTSSWTMIVGGGYAMATLFPHLGCIGPWIAASCLIGISAGYLWFRWRAGGWKRINLFKEQREPGEQGAVGPTQPKGGESQAPAAG